MKSLAGIVMAATLLVGSGCAKQDWIDRTLVTVDVTGTWEGNMGGSPGFGGSRDVVLELTQQGSTVKGSIEVRGGGSSAFRNIPGPVDGTVAGDVFRFRNTRGNAEGELTVNGEEMSGTVSMFGTRPLTLRRVAPSSPPVSPPR
jgi:hypothetical protein